MQYNAYRYNASEYDLTAYNVNLFDSVSESDTLTKSVSIIRTDSQGTADALSDAASMAALLDTVTIYQRARTPFAYNNGRYNDYMYNVRADEDEILLKPTKALGDIVTLTGVISALSAIRLLTETVTDTDLVLFMANRLLEESIFIDESARIEISNKALNEIIRTADWLTIDRRPVNQEWGD